MTVYLIAHGYGIRILVSNEVCMWCKNGENGFVYLEKLV